MKHCIFYFVLWVFVTSCKTNDENKETLQQVSTQDKELQLAGTIANNESVDGDLNIMGFFVEPLYSGTLNKDGSFSITLPESFDTITQKAFDTYNQQDAAAYRLTMNTVAQTFINLDGLETKGLNHEIALAGKYYGFTVYKDNDRDGAIYPTSSTEFMTYIIEQKQEGALTGFYYAFIYATQESAIKGKSTYEAVLDEQTSTTFTYTEEYDIALNPGWNIMKYEILKTEKTAQNTSIPAHVKQYTVTRIDKDIPWFHIRKKSQAL